MASVLRETLDKLVYLEFSATVSTKAGSVSVGMNQDGLIEVEVIVEYTSDRWQSARRFKKSEVGRLIAYLGDITEIITLDHNTDEEIVVYRK
jgi:hypothetical protein